MLCYFTTTYIGEMPMFVYQLTATESEWLQTEENANEKRLLDDIESLLRAYRPNIFTDCKQSS